MFILLSCWLFGCWLNFGRKLYFDEVVVAVVLVPVGGILLVDVFMSKVSVERNCC